MTKMKPESKISKEEAKKVVKTTAITSKFKILMNDINMEKAKLDFYKNNIHTGDNPINILKRSIFIRPIIIPHTVQNVPYMIFDMGLFNISEKYESVHTAIISSVVYQKILVEKDIDMHSFSTQFNTKLLKSFVENNKNLLSSDLDNSPSWIDLKSAIDYDDIEVYDIDQLIRDYEFAAETYLDAKIKEQDIIDILDTMLPNIG